MVTEAYQKGRRAKSYADNPYDKNSGEYNDSRIQPRSAPLAKLGRIA